jgi:hypothetical protein
MDAQEGVYRTVGAPQATAKQRRVQTKVVDIECPVDKETAANILGISVDTLDQWTARYGIPHIKYGMDGNRGNKGIVRYLPSDLLAFRARYRVEGRDVQDEVEEMVSQPGKSPSPPTTAQGRIKSGTMARASQKSGRLCQSLGCGKDQSQRVNGVRPCCRAMATGALLPSDGSVEASAKCRQLRNLSGGCDVLASRAGRSPSA